MMFPDTKERICVGCHGPRVSQEVSPGVHQYEPCARCGAIGIVRPGYEARAILTPHPKKQNRGFYENSRYRGGKLTKQKKKKNAATIDG